jgi:hypothetical protein
MWWCCCPSGPSAFTSERLAQYGVFSGRDRAVNRIRLQRVWPEHLQRLANLAWGERGEAAKAAEAVSCISSGRRALVLCNNDE